MKTVKLGRTDLQSSVIGLGCMGMSEFYGTTNETESQAVLDRALQLGVSHLDTSDLYGRGANEELVGRFLRRHGRRDVLVATKFGILRDPDGPAGSTYDRVLDNSPTHARAACEASLKRLGVDTIDLYYVHRHDPSIAIEEVVGGLADLVREGKIRAIGLSEVSVDTLRRAHGEHPIAALQSEYSLFAREVEADVLPACRELDIAFLAYSPLGRGILGGRIRSLDDLAPDDLRRSAPIFSAEHLPGNLALVDRVRAIADRHGATPGQVALAWLIAQGVIPIAGTKRVRYLEENAGAAELMLDAEDLDTLDRALAPGTAGGAGKWSTVPQPAAAR